MPEIKSFDDYRRMTRTIVGKSNEGSDLHHILEKVASRINAVDSISRRQAHSLARLCLADWICDSGIILSEDSQYDFLKDFDQKVVKGEIQKAPEIHERGHLQNLAVAYVLNYYYSNKNRGR